MRLAIRHSSNGMCHRASTRQSGGRDGAVDDQSLDLKNDQAFNVIRKNYETEKQECINLEKEKSEKAVLDMEKKCEQKLSQCKDGSKQQLLKIEREHIALAENELKEDLIKAKSVELDEDNYKEAIEASFKVFVPQGISSNLKRILDDTCAEVDSSSSDFWVMVAALKEFIANEGGGEAPLEGSIPYMTSSTKYKPVEEEFSSPILPEMQKYLTDEEYSAMDEDIFRLKTTSLQWSKIAVQVGQKGLVLYDILPCCWHREHGSKVFGWLSYIYRVCKAKRIFSSITPF
ncbi:hypothetical protein L2E82_50489 [Cichorium intybus]|nr:hypothetical protein L2E82_50489 [Cichorium intybus]